MVSWFVAGGFPMFPVLVVGAMAVVAAFRHASMPGRGWANAAATLRTATMALGVAGLAFDVSAVSDYVAGMAEAEMVQVMLVTTVGLGEATGPLVLAGLLAGLSALTAAAGDLRDARDLPAAT